MNKIDEGPRKGDKVRTLCPPTTVNRVNASHFPSGIRGTVVGHKRHGNTVLIIVAFEFCGTEIEFARYYREQLEVLE